MRNNPEGDISDEADILGPVPEPLSFEFIEPELLDADMLEMLAYPESKVSPSIHFLKFAYNLHNCCCSFVAAAGEAECRHAHGAPQSQTEPPAKHQKPVDTGSLTHTPTPFCFQF